MNNKKTATKKMSARSEKHEVQAPVCLKEHSGENRKLYEAMLQADDECIKIKSINNGVLELETVASDVVQGDLNLLKTTGTKGLRAAEFIAKQMSMLGTAGSKIDENAEESKKLSFWRANDMLSLLHGIAPRDNIESMLVVQMIGTHMQQVQCTVDALRRGQSDEIIEKRINQATKLSRSFVAQMAALDKHRGKGQQKMTVEHVHVNEGGQAVIGNVEQPSDLNNKGAENGGK